MGVNNFLAIWKALLLNGIKAKWAYKVDFMIGIIANFLIQTVGFVTLNIIFSHIDSLYEWNYYEILFLYGYAAIPRGMSELFFNGVWRIGTYIRKGDLDAILTKPLNPLVYVVMSDTEPHGAGSIIFGIIVCFYTGSHIGLNISYINVCYLIISTIAGTVIYVSINVIIASISFCAIRVSSLMVLVNNFDGFSKYPLSLYGSPVRIILSTIIPFGFTSYYPIALILQKNDSIIGYFSILVSIVFLFIANMTWRKGLMNYQSTGS